MILENLFIHLRKPGVYRFWASTLYTLYGTRLIGKPKPEDIGGLDMDAKERISRTYFEIPTERMPPKRNKYWEHSQLFAAQLRDEEEKPVSKMVYIWTVVLCTALIAAGSTVGKMGAGFEKWNDERKAQAAVAEAAKYQEQRTGLIEKWTSDAADYSAQRCVDETAKLRNRSAERDRDRYDAIRTSCEPKAREIEGIAIAMSLSACTKYGDQLRADIKNDGRETWADRLVFGGCEQSHGNAFTSHFN